MKIEMVANINTSTPNGAKILDKIYAMVKELHNLDLDFNDRINNVTINFTCQSEAADLRNWERLGWQSNIIK